jgi:hypothetical protein
MQSHALGGFISSYMVYGVLRGFIGFTWFMGVLSGLWEIA